MDSRFRLIYTQAAFKLGLGGSNHFKVELLSHLLFVDFGVLDHVVPLDESAVAEWTAMRFLTVVNLAVSVQRTRICQLFEANFALDHRLSTGSNLRSSVSC